MMLEVQLQRYGTVVTAVDIGQYLRVGNAGAQSFAGDKVVDAPPCILLTRLETV